MSVHFVRHLLSPGNDVKTEFQCTAKHGAHCRMSCDRCRAEEQCICAGNDLKPDLQDQGECLMILWLREDSEWTFCGEQTEVRGPGWQPIEVTWDGDCCEWEYAS